MDPVDAYAKIKSDNRALEEEAAEMRANFLPLGARLRSNQHEVVIKQQTRRLFQKDLLAPVILNDPRYWSGSTSEVVTVKSPENCIKPLNKKDYFAITERF